MNKSKLSTAPEFSQADLLKNIEMNYQTSTTFSDEIDTQQCAPIENESMAPSSSIAHAAEAYISDENDLGKLHIRNMAQTKHINVTEKAALAHWAK